MCWPANLSAPAATIGGRSTTYETRLRPFIHAKQPGAERFISFFATRTRFGLWFRNQAMRAMNFGPLATVLAGGVRDDFELPDYGI